MESMYRNYVDVQYTRNPCLSYLHNFLHTPKAPRGKCRIIDFGAWGPDQSRISMDVGELKEILYQDLQNGQKDFSSSTSDSNLFQNQSNRLLIVENISPKIMELLGTGLGVDPAFFASHVDGPIITSDGQTPGILMLPSQRKSRRYLNIHFHQAFMFERNWELIPRIVLLDCNIDRKLSFLSPKERRTIALARRAVSILQLSPGSKWRGSRCSRAFLLLNANIIQV